MLLRLIKNNRYRLKNWMDDSYLVMRAGYRLCKFSVFFVILAHFLEGVFTQSTGSSVARIYGNLIGAIREAIYPLLITITLAIIDSFKRNLPKLYDSVKIFDLLFGWLFAFSGGYFIIEYIVPAIAARWRIWRICSLQR